MPFGGCFHLDHIVVGSRSRAAKSAKCALVILDQETKFLGGFPGNSRASSVVVSEVHHYEGADPKQRGRRWWTDSAAEFEAASRNIRSERALAHFRGIPHAHTSCGIIERMIRTLVEGTNAALIQAGASAEWWCLALVYWAMMWNAFREGQDGLTPYERRHDGEKAPYPA